MKSDRIVYATNETLKEALTLDIAKLEKLGDKEVLDYLERDTCAFYRNVLIGEVQGYYGGFEEDDPVADWDTLTNEGEEFCFAYDVCPKCILFGGYDSIKDCVVLASELAKKNNITLQEAALILTRHALSVIQPINH